MNKNLNTTVPQNILDNFVGDGKHKLHAVMLFNTEIELGISNTPNKWVCTSIVFFDNGFQALDFYANTPNPASQIISEYSPEKLEQSIQDMLHNYQDDKWLEDNLYPYL